MTNIKYLRAVSDVLNDAVDQIGQIASVIAEYPDADLRLVARIEATKRLLLERRAYLASAHEVRRPIVLDPYELPSILSHQGQQLTPTIAAPDVATEGISSADVWMPPGHASFAHVHYHTDIIVLVHDGEAITLWWDQQGDMHELPQRAGQHLHIPAGVPHAAINLGNRSVTASEFRSNRVLDADNIRLPELEPAVTERMPTADRPVAQ